jgi:hypothetical protein
MNHDIHTYHSALTNNDKSIADKLYQLIDTALPNAESKVWHGHPVWFIDGNPVVGYDVRKSSVGLLFWSGQSFVTPGLTASGSFKAATIKFTDSDHIDADAITKWLAESIEIQWDYKNIVKRRGELLRLK